MLEVKMVPELLIQHNLEFSGKRISLEEFPRTQWSVDVFWGKFL